MPAQAMVISALAFAGFVLLLGAWGFFYPRSIVDFIESWSSKGGLWLAVLLRVSFGVVLWFAAPLSRTPEIFEGLGGLVVLSGVVLPLFGYTRFQAFIKWWSELPPGVMRVWCLVAILLGGFVFWSAVRPITFSRPEQPIQYRDSGRR